MKNNKNNLITTENNNNIGSIDPTVSYKNADTQKIEILKANKEKAGIYRWTHKESGKNYVGSAIDLSKRLRSYYNLSYLYLETKKNNSLIYKAILKYGYSSFKLDILEYCDAAFIIDREQYYLDNFKFEYNTLKIARSLAGFKHSTYSINRMRIARLGKSLSESTKLKLSANSQAFALTVKNNKTGEVILFTSIRKTAKFIGIHHSYLAKCLNIKKIYVGKGYSITKK